MPGESGMLTEARRLRAAVEANTEFGDLLPAGAGGDELEALRLAIRPLFLPDELFDLLSVMDGTGGSWVTLGSIGPLLSCREIVDATRERSWKGSGIPWCPAWTVISLEGWTFAAVFSGQEPASSSPVVDLTYGNQDVPVAAASLTALISASADAWERGWRDRTQMDASWWSDVYAPLTRAADRRHPGTGLLAAGDAVSSDSVAWPESWPPDDSDADLAPREEVELASTREGRCTESLVDVVAREGQILSVADASGADLVYLPPAFDPAARIVAGARVRLVLIRRSMPRTRPEELHTLECRGILPA